MGLVSQPSAGFELALDGVPLLEFDAVASDARWVASAAVAPAGDGAASRSLGELPATLEFECRAANAEDGTGIMTLTLPVDRLAPGSRAELRVTGRAAASLRWFGLLVP
jgi:hypothetical protein